MPATSFRVRACSRWSRAAAAVLQALAAVNLLGLAVRAALDLAAPVDPERVPLPYLVQRLFYFGALPALLSLVLQRRATLRIEGDRATVAGAEIPFSSLAALVPWRVPLPLPGFSLRLRSGRVLPLGLCARDPGPAAASLCIAAGLAAPESAWFRDASVRERTRVLHHPAIKFALVPAAVAFILFRLHQLISYGGFFGEWQTYGLARWLHTLTGVVLYVLGHFVLLAAGLRALAELAAQPVIHFAPRYAKAARWTVEIAAAVLYYGGTAAVLLLRLG